MPRFPETAKETPVEILARDQDEIVVKLPLRPDFESDYLTVMGERIDHCMQELKPYLHPECNLAYLSKLIDVPAHHVGYYFREIKKQPFNDFRNEWRINHAKDLIRVGKTNDLTLEAIGLASGFSTRNTFYRCFYKVEGITPSLYASKVLGVHSDPG